MLLDLIRFIRGSVRFEILSPFPERFLNITAMKRISVWDAERREDRMIGSMYKKDYLRIRPTARSAKARLRIKKKRGLPVLLRRYRGRVGLALGAFAFILTVFLMSQFIWSIEITGLDRISQTRLQDDLREEGLFVGAFKPLLDYDRISRNVMIRNKDVGWMAVNVSGSYASVEIKEESLPPEVENVYEPCNIKAKCDAAVVRIETGAGETMIIEGSGVVKDQLLVSGVLEDDMGGVSFVHSEAVILGRTEHTACFETEKKRAGLRFTGEVKERKKLRFLGLEYPLALVGSSSPHSAARSVEEQLRFLDVNIPVGVTTERIAGFEREERMLDDSAANELLMKSAGFFEAFSLSDCEITDRDYMFSETKNGYKLDVSYSCIENIAYQSPIYVREQEQE